MKPSKRRGFTITELTVALIVTGLLAVIAMPKIKAVRDEGAAKSLVRESFQTVGDAYMARMKDPDYPPAPASVPINGAEISTFANYLYTHTNYLSAMDPAGITDADYCGFPQDYFVMPLGWKIRQICADTVSTPRRLLLTVFVPRQGNDITYTVVIPEGGKRYTTRYGYNPAITTTCTDADKLLNITSACP